MSLLGTWGKTYLHNENRNIQNLEKHQVNMENRSVICGIMNGEQESLCHSRVWWHIGQPFGPFQQDKLRDYKENYTEGHWVGISDQLKLWEQDRELAGEEKSKEHFTAKINRQGRNKSDWQWRMEAVKDIYWVIYYYRRRETDIIFLFL